MYYSIVEQNSEKEIVCCKLTDQRSTVIESVEVWAEENNVSLDPDQTTAEIYYDESVDGEFISQIIDEDVGVISVFTVDVE